jgi:hypothetical protein
MSGPLTRWLRILIAAEWLLVIIAVPLAFFLESTLPVQLRQFLAAEYEKPFSFAEAIQLVAMFITLALWLAGSVGTFMLWRYGRPLYLAAVVTGVAFTPFVGPSVMAPLASAFAEASQAIAGVVLGLLYFSPLRDRFQLGASALPNPHDRG